VHCRRIKLFRNCDRELERHRGPSRWPFTQIEGAAYAQSCQSHDFAGFDPAGGVKCICRAPGKPAGVKQAQDQDVSTPLLVMGAAAIGIGIALAVSDDGNSTPVNPPNTTTTTTTGTGP
jgi:hypothetical protein